MVYGTNACLDRRRYMPWIVNEEEMAVGDFMVFFERAGNAGNGVLAVNGNQRRIGGLAC